MQKKGAAPLPGKPPDTLEVYEAGAKKGHSFRQWMVQHKAGGLSLALLVLLGLSTIFADFLSIHSPDQRVAMSVIDASPRGAPLSLPPIWPSWIREGELRWPYICAAGRWEHPYDKVKKRHLQGKWVFVRDCSQRYFLRFLVHVPNYKYKLLGLFETDIHLFGAAKPGTPLFLAQADPQALLLPLGATGRGDDLLSNTLVGGRASLAISLIAVLLSLVLALPLGGLSGYLGGKTDTLIQRVTDGIMAFPRLALLLVLGATFVKPGLRLWGMILLLGVLGWAPIARTLRGQILSLREADFIAAAWAIGASHGRILLRHILPQTISTILVLATLAIPNVLVLESFLDYLNRGVPEGIASWGSLLKDVGEIASLPLHPWVLFSGVPIILTVLAFTFLGDALRDWFDPFRESRAT